MVKEVIFIASEQRFGNDMIVGKKVFEDNCELRTAIEKSKNFACILSELRNSEPITFTVMTGEGVEHTSEPIIA